MIPTALSDVGSQNLDPLITWGYQQTNTLILLTNFKHRRDTTWTICQFNKFTFYGEDSIKWGGGNGQEAYTSLAMMEQKSKCR